MAKYLSADTATTMNTQPLFAMFLNGCQKYGKINLYLKENIWIQGQQCWQFIIPYQYGSGIWNDRRYDSSNIEKTKKNESKATKNIKTVLKEVPALEIFWRPLSNLGKTITVKRLPKSPMSATVVKAKYRGKVE